MTDLIKNKNQDGKRNKWLPYEEAHAIALQECKKYGIDTVKKWYAHNNKFKKYRNIPTFPPYIYKYDWCGWENWLGFYKNEFLPFEDARKIAREECKKYNINSIAKWVIHNNKFKKYRNIPTFPNKLYKGQFKSWMDWHGFETKHIDSKDFLTFEQAHKIVLRDCAKYGIKSQLKWHNIYIKNGHKGRYIPSNPEKIYKDKWVNWGHWLGNGRKRYSVNHDFFKKWSRDMAYVYGFFLADGCISRIERNGYYSYAFSISQNTKDAYILKNILDIMSSDALIYSPSTRKNASSFSITSKQIYDDIIRLGGCSRKSLKTKFPKSIPDKYLADFIRGYFDGDGCISYSNKEHTIYNSYICSGTYNLLKNIRDRLIKYNIYSKLYKSTKREFTFLGRKCIDTCHRLIFSTVPTRNLGTFMYYNKMNHKLKLNRKYERFKKSMEIYK